MVQKAFKTILQNLEIWEQFDCIVGRQEVIHPKPHPEPVLKALELMKIDKDQKCGCGCPKQIADCRAWPQGGKHKFS